ncbi:hypothetical protein BH10ACI2_BH10ACI2_05070 [soil metagenome]
MKVAFVKLAFVLCSLVSVVIPATAQNVADPNSTLSIVVTDPKNLMVGSVTCSLIQNGKTVSQQLTDENGTARFDNVVKGTYDLKLEKEGFQKAVKRSINLGHEPLELAFVLAVSDISAQVTVTNTTDDTNSISSGSSPANGILSKESIERLPLANRRVDEAIPLVPGVIRSSTGEISINGATEQQSAFRVNGINIADPASGNFRLNLPIDAVESVQVFRHPYSAEFGQFTGGLTEIQTKRGGETWHFEANDFLPDFRWVNGKIHGIQDDTPHVSFNGPIFKDRLYLSQSLAYSISKSPVRGLLFPNNETKSESQSYFSQLDLIISPTHTAGFTFGYFPQRQSFIGLDFFKPKEATPNYKQKDFNAALRNSYTFANGSFLQASVSYKRFLANVWGQGSGEQNLTPVGEQGNYFSSQDRQSSRTEAFVSFDAHPFEIFGQSHSIKAGLNVSEVANLMDYSARPVNILRIDGTLAERTTFENTSTMKVKNQTYTGFVQDRWLVRSNLSIDLGVRFEDQRIASERNVSPRVGFAWSPASSDRTIFRGGIGFFYDKVPLNIRAFRRYPARTITRFDSNGRTIIDEHRYFNILVDDLSLLPLGFRKARSIYGFVPQNLAWNLQIDQVVNPNIRLRANYSHSRTERIYSVQPETDYFGGNAVVLSPSGRAQYDALELTGKFALNNGQEIVVSYVRSKARGNLNDINSYFGDFGDSIIRKDQFSNLSTDVPDRFLAWGNIALPMKFVLSPIVEWRSGFPYSVLDANRDFVGVRNANNRRFPKFFSVDMEVSKDIQVSKKYAVRLSVKAFNLMNHFNPRNVRNNITDPNFGSFINSYRRYFTGGFDIIF